MPRPANPHLAYDILRATADLVELKGPDGVTMREVAERVGYSPTTIYLYYENKDDLLDSAVNRAFEWFGSQIEEAGAGLSNIQRIRNGAYAYVEWGIQNPGMYRLMFEHARTNVPSPETVTARRHSWKFTRSLIAEAVESGELGKIEDLDAATNTIWATLHGLTSLSISGRLWTTPSNQKEALAKSRALVDLLVDQWLAAWSLK